MYWKRYLALGVLVVGSLYSAAPVQAELIDISDCRLQEFKVTAYYSPKKGQTFYYRGNHEDEVILNGRGTHGASGRPVFNGMIAAPATYAFGTKLFFPGFGIGQIEDRGGAIVSKGQRGEEYDRIDVWMGAGEEGLKRALSFGVQYMDAYVCEGPTGDRVGFDYSKFPIKDNFFASSLWVLQLEEGREDKWVETLQRYLSRLNYFPSDRITGYFGPVTKESVCKFQKDTLGLTEESIWCGYFGAQTRSALYQSLQRRGLLALEDTTTPTKQPTDIALASAETEESVPVEEPETVEAATAQELEKQNEEKQEDEPKVAPRPTETDTKKNIPLTEEMNAYYLRIGDSRKYQFLAPIRLGDTGKEVSLLQRKLQWLGYYTDRVSGTYDTKTMQAVYAFQLDQGVLKGDEDPALFGYFGPTTRKTLNNF